MQIESLPVDLPRLPILGVASQGDQRGSLPDVRASGAPIFTTSGRAAIALGLEAIGVGPTDSVLVPTYHCPTMVAPILRVGAAPVFFPITREGIPDLEWLERNAGKAKAMLVPHYFGIPRDLASIRAFCDARGIALLEDCAHTFFGVAGDRPIGTWGDVTTASLTKFFPGPDGGLLVIRSAAVRPVIVKRLPALDEARAWLDTFEMSARYGRLGAINFLVHRVFRFKALVRGTPSAQNREVLAASQVPMTSCLDERLIPMRASAAARWVVRTSAIERVISRRQRNYRLLIELLDGVSGVGPVFPVLPETAVPYVCPISVRAANLVYGRLRNLGIPIFRWDVLWPGTPVLHGDWGREWSQSLLQVACHQDLSEEDMQLIARRIVQVATAVRSEQGGDGGTG